jgi:hypothetical protein
VTLSVPLSHLTFRRNIFWVEEETSQESSMRQAENSVCFLIHAGFLLGLLFNPEDGGEIFIRNVK